MLYFLQFSSDDRNISHNAQGQRQGQVKVEAVQALHFEAYRLVKNLAHVKPTRRSHGETNGSEQLG